MLCTTVRQGAECVFMSKRGCTFNGGACIAVVEACEGCGRAVSYPTGIYCTACPDPTVKWKNGNCNLATHVKAETKVTASKLNPLKASKRGGH